jgi:hypothetical protein
VSSAATLIGPRTPARSATTIASMASSPWMTWTIGSNPIQVGMIGEPSSRMIGVSSVRPRIGWKRSIVQTTSGWRRANAATRFSDSATSRCQRVVCGKRVAMSSVKKAGALGSEP